MISKKHAIKSKKDVDMTQGNIFKHLFAFALPLLIGNVFQQLYNTVDTWVVGRFVSNEAYAAVGSITPITRLLVGFFMGLSTGAGVVISQYYGAKRYDQVQRVVHTTVSMTIILGIGFTAIGLIISPLALQLMKTPENVYPQSITYLRIYFSGLLGLMIYNMGASVLRAVGDSKRPFYFLMVCAVMNTVLDLFFVIVLDFGVAGVALATVLAQFTSAALVIFTLLRSENCIQLHPKHLRLHWDILKKIFKVGIPAALQMSITSFSNIFTQSYINFFGSNVMSGWTTYLKIDQLLFLPVQSISLASTSFVGQNLGCGQVSRAKKGVTISMVMACVSAISLMLPVILFAPQLVGFFNQKPEVIQCGTLLLRYVTPFYILRCFNQIYIGALRGAGNSKVPMFAMLSSFVVLRQLYLFIMSRICNEILPIAFSYPVGWLACCIFISIYYHRTNLSKTALVDSAE